MYYKIRNHQLKHALEQYYCRFFPQPVRVRIMIVGECSCEISKILKIQSKSSLLDFKCLVEYKKQNFRMLCSSFQNCIFHDTMNNSLSKPIKDLGCIWKALLIFYFYFFFHLLLLLKVAFFKVNLLAVSGQHSKWKFCPYFFHFKKRYPYFVYPKYPIYCIC